MADIDVLQKSATADGRTEKDGGEWVSFATTAVLYIVAFVVLDRISFLHPFSEVGITPWDPPQGLTLAVLLRMGMRFAPLVPVATLLAEALVRHVAAPWLPILPTLISVSITAAGYVGASALLLKVFRIDPDLRRLSDMVRLLIVGLIAALAVAGAVVGNFIAFNMIAEQDFWPAVLRSWLGDFVGILTLTPALLVFTGSHMQTQFAKTLRAWVPYGFEILLQVAAVIGMVWFVFGLDFVDELKLFYLLFLPAIWIAVRHGVGGAAACVLLTQVALKVAFQSRGFGASTVIDFQMLMVALGLACLLVGAIISERRQASEALRESETRLKAILDTAPDAILTLNAAGEIELANPAVERMFGWTAQALVGRSIASLLPALDLVSSHPRREIRGHRRDGTTFPAEISLGQAVVSTGLRTIAVARDISRRIEAEAQIRQHQVELAHADRVSMVGEMATAIAHEESQPLAAIAAYTRACRMLLQVAEPDMTKVRESLDKLAAQTVRAGDILNRLRAFLHRGEIEAETLSVIDIVHDVTEFARTDATERGIRLAIDLEPAVPLVIADRIHIQQVLLNLVRNAMESISDSPDDLREVRISARHKGNRVVLTVRDTGPGIDPTIAEQLFKPFTSTKERGMGLGLSICRTIVAAHGGQLRHLPGERPGATFCFDLPVAQGEA